MNISRGRHRVKMRLGKHEKAILETLRVYSESPMDWTWPEGQTGLGRLANQEDINRYEAGDIVPISMLRRDIPCGKAVLSRSLRTLQKKGLVVLLDGSLGEPYPEVGFSKYAKYVSLCAKRQVYKVSV